MPCIPLFDTLNCVKRTSIHGVSPYEAQYGFSRAVRVGNRIHVAGTAPVPELGCEPEQDAFGQMLRCGTIAKQAIERLGGSLHGVIRTRMFIVDAADAHEVGRAHKELFGDVEPVATMVVVAALLEPSWRIEIEVEAMVGSETGD